MEGWGTAKCQMKRLTLIVLLLAALLFGLDPLSSVASGIPDPRFGVVEAYEAPTAAAVLGAGWTRVTFRWNEIQPNGPEEWNVVPISDQALANELRQGRQVVGLLVTTPSWATDTGIGPGVPQGLYLPVDDPSNLWATFVRAIVDRYTGRIDHWIIWNEPDIPDTRHMSWGGSTEDFVRLLQVAYIVAKEINPDAVIHMAAVTHWWDENWFSEFLDVLVADPAAAVNNYYFDVATLHIYFQPETVYKITAHYDRMMRDHGIHKPIWIAETNAAPSNDPTWPVPDAQFDVSLEEQASYIVQAFSLGIAGGADRISVYKMADTDTDRAANPEPFGLVRMDGSRRPAFTAYQVATTHLAGFRGGTWKRRDGVSIVTIDRGERTTTVVWTRTPESETVMIPARRIRALLVDVQGGARYVYPERGYYFIDLPGANCAQGCLIGGTPYMLVEEASASADTAPTSRSSTPAAETTPVGTTPNLDDTSVSTSTLTPTPTTIFTRRTGLNTTPTPTSTPTPMPTATMTPTSTPIPSPTPIPLSRSDASLNRSWILVGVLTLGLAGAALAADRIQIRASRSGGDSVDREAPNDP